MADPVTTTLLEGVGGYQAVTGRGFVGKLLKVPRPPAAPPVPGISDTAAAADALRRKLAGQFGFGSALMLSQAGGGVRYQPPAAPKAPGPSAEMVDTSKTRYAQPRFNSWGLVRRLTAPRPTLGASMLLGPGGGA